MTAPTNAGCERTERVAEYALQALAPDEAAAFRAHIETCPACRAELEALQPVVDGLVDWPTDVLRPPRPLWDRVARRLGEDASVAPEVAAAAAAAPAGRWAEEPAWNEVAPGISCKLLSTDKATGAVSMLVRLAPGVSYPPHQHAGREELHLLFGELWIEDRLLYPGDYNRAEAGTADQRVYSETGCMCVLITSYDDKLG